MTGSVERLLELRRWYVTDLAVQPAVVEPIDVLEGLDLDLINLPPRAAPADQLGLVEPDPRFGQGVVIRISDRPDRGGDPVFGEALGVDDRGVLTGLPASEW